ncbi:S9 family peptidase [Oceanicaulis sp.]|uniref:S9 family peptidase n=1 Tax=Oceanicaulis sp. TaxID=1924941 RepID=UPI003F6F499E
MSLSAFRLALILSCACVSASAMAQTTPPPMNAIDFLSLEKLSEPQAAPGGRYYSFEVSTADWGKNRRDTALHIRRLTDNSDITITLPEGEDDPVDNAVWSPRGDAFVTEMELEDDDREQLYLYTVATGEFRRLTDHGASISSPVWAPDGETIYFRAEEPLSETESWLRRKRWVLTAYDVDEPDLVWSVSLETGEVQPVLAAPDGYVRGLSISADGQSLLISSAPGPLIDDRQAGELWRYDLAERNFSQLTWNTHSESSAQLSPDGARFAYIATVNAAGEPYYEDNLFVQRVGARQAELILPDLAMEVADFAWDATSTGVFILGNTGLRTQLYHYDLSSRRLNALTSGDHVISDWSFDPDTGLHSFIRTDASTPGEMYLGTTETGFQPVTRWHGGLGERFALPAQQAVSWSAEDGQRIEGLLVRPVGYETGDVFPLITIVHGGPRSSSQFGAWNTSRAIPVLTGQGYGVLLPNHRGGTGYGDAFMRDMVGGYFTHADTDVLAGVDAMVVRGLADPERLIIMGWSAGGHMTNRLITVTDRFIAASSGAGASDWVSMYGESDTRFNRTPWFSAAPWQEGADPSVYQAHSPLWNAWKVTTPTLFFVGESDERVPPTQSIMMHRGVQAAGVDTRLYVAPDQPHNYRRLSYQLFKINTELSWFAEHADLPEYRPVLPEQASMEHAGADNEEASDEGVEDRAAASPF